VPEASHGEGKSAAWGAVAGILGSGAFATGIAAATSAMAFPYWPSWSLGLLTIGSTFMCFAMPSSRWSLRRRAGQGPGWPAMSRGSRQVDVSLAADREGPRLRLLLHNQGKPAEFSAQVIAFHDPMGRGIGRQIWTVPWQDDLSTEPKLILTGQTGILDFALYDFDAVRDEITAGGGDSPHWMFSTAPSPVAVRYYNLRSGHDLSEQRFRIVVRIMNARTGKYADRELIVGAHGNEITCRVATGNHALSSHLSHAGRADRDDLRVSTRWAAQELAAPYSAGRMWVVLLAPALLPWFCGGSGRRVGSLGPA
jgi:hypothetical protein